MNIAFDASDLCTGRADGTTRYTIELAKRLPELGKDDEWDFYGPNFLPSYEGRRGGVERDVHTPSRSPLSKGEKSNVKWKSTPFPFGWTQTRFAYELFRNKPDVLFMPIQQLPIFRPRKTKTVAVIHDLAFHEFSQQFRYKDWLLLHTFSAQVAREADAIIAVSQATKDDIKKYYGRTEHVHVIHHGIDHDRFKVFSDSEKHAGFQKIEEKYPEITKPYILFVGQIQPRKNIMRLVEAFERLHSNSTYLTPTSPSKGEETGATPFSLRRRRDGDEVKLVIAGGYGWNNEEIYKRIAQSPARKNIVVTGAVPDDLLAALYANAAVFVLPSLQEGFGIPLLEAAACGVPIVTSNCSSMKEIAEGTGVLIDPKDSTSIANGIQDALKNHNELSNKSIALAQKFSWDITARETLRVLKEVTNI